MGLTTHTIEVAGRERNYRRADGPGGRNGLLVVIHGTGIDAAIMAGWTGLADRGPAAGFETVFPEALSRIWDDAGGGRVDGADDAAFIAALIERLPAAQAGVVLVGLSNGAFFAERLVRHGLVDARGIALVAGTAREASRRAAPIPRRPCAVLHIVGTADPTLPYGGGRARPVIGWIAHRRARAFLVDIGGRESVAPEELAMNWSALNGGDGQPARERIADDRGGLPIEKLTWPTAAHPVTLYRAIGGGHGWPGGPQYAPRFLVGRISRTFDATAAVLDFARKVSL